MSIEDDIAALKSETEEKLDQIIDDRTKPKALRQAAFDILHEQAMQELAAAVKDFSAGTDNFLSLIGSLAKSIADLQKNPEVGAAPELEAIMRRASEVYGNYRDERGLPTTHANTEEALKPPADETAEKPSGDPAPLKPEVATGIPLSAPTPRNARDYPSLSDEYIRFFLGAGYRSAADKKTAEKFAATALQRQSDYKAVGDPLGIPWWFIAGVHMLESSFNFNTHLHNGDPLARRTVRVPANRPAAGEPPFSWVESAKDALQGKGLAGQSDWSLPRALFRWEAYNGFGYRKRNVPTPYLWSLSTIYAKGKFVRDGEFDADAVSRQCGAAVLLKFLHEAGNAPLNLDYTGEPEAQTPEDAPPPTGPATANASFEDFFRQNLSGMRYFKAADFLFKGASHATNGLNTDPPRELWPNVVKLARILDALRERIGKPIVLLSIYRSERYNAAVGGAAGSQHKRFCAADLRVTGPGAGSPNDWAAELDKMRHAGEFQGGIGTYPRFVHVDTRGWNTNWE